MSSMLTHEARHITGTSEGYDSVPLLFVGRNRQLDFIGRLFADRTAKKGSDALPTNLFARHCDQLERQQWDELFRGVLELGKHLKRVLCAASQHDLVVDQVQAVIRDNNQVRIHAEETADR
jgi:hypothetical protein